MSGTDDQDAGSRRIRRVLLGFLALGLLALAGAVGAAAWINGRIAVHAASVAHTYQVEVAVGEARRLTEQQETTRRGYLLVPDNPDFLQAFEQASAQLRPALDRIVRLTADNPRQRAHIDALRREYRDLDALRQATMRLVRERQVARATALFRQEIGARRMRRVRAIFDAMTAEERRLLRGRDAELAGATRAFYAALVVAAVLLALVVAATLLTVLRYTRDLNDSLGRVERLNDTLEAQVEERTADLTRANEEIQRFAYIVSHDLRSPLVNVMGFTAELEAASEAVAALIDRAEAEAPQVVTEAARLAAREDLPEAIGFIRTSTAKMDRLINAILKLSREGRRVLAPEPLAIGAVVETIRASLAHRLADERAELRVEGKLPVMVSDRVAVEQILSNLIENALKYGQPGRPVRVVVSAQEAAGRVRIAVADNGRGIAEADHGRVFDLFRRSGPQDQPGEGIGLAHVRALALRLGGTIDMTSELGQGSTFTLSLPRVLAAEDRSA
jgi:signal transduction histidine kinase